MNATLFREIGFNATLCRLERDHEVSLEARSSDDNFLDTSGDTLYAIWNGGESEAIPVTGAEEADSEDDVGSDDESDVWDSDECYTSDEEDDSD